MEEGLIENAAELGSQLHEMLSDLPPTLVTSVRGKGLLHAIVIKPQSNGLLISYWL